MAKQWSEIRTENPAGPLTGAEVTVAVQGGQSVGLTYQQLKDWVKFKNKLDATVDPGVNDDSTAGYEPGSRWLNNAPSPKVWWICTDATAGAAVWDVLSLSEDELGTAALVNTGTGAGDVPLNSDLGTAAYEQFNRMPFPNLIGWSGRFADLSGQSAGVFSRSLGSSPFTSTSYFTGYNGSTFSSAGQFIHNNDDFGGSAGAMTQDVIDLLAALGRGGNNARYGVEFNILEIQTGSGTIGGQPGTSGDLYLVATNGSKAIFGADNFSTFCGWVRALDGEGGLFGGVAGSINFVNGVQTTPDTIHLLQPADGWVFVESFRPQLIGYDASFPRFYGEQSVTRIQIALPAAFPGWVRTGGHAAPIPSAGMIT